VQHADSAQAVTKRAGRKKDAGGAKGADGGRDKGQIKRAVFETTKKKEVGVSDLTLISKISNEAINDNLKKRFENAEIYTYIGHVLVSVNPFRDCRYLPVLEAAEGRANGLQWESTPRPSSIATGAKTAWKCPHTSSPSPKLRTTT
jgi:hypothetical protein